jgi:hypothetical protein
MRRNNGYVDAAYQRDLVWLIWECLFFYAESSSSDKPIRALHRLFCAHYRPAVPKRRRHLLYFAVSLYFEDATASTAASTPSPPLVPADRRDLVRRAVRRLPRVVYRQIKRNEVAPRTEYLFANVVDSRSEFDKSLAKLALMNRQDEARHQSRHTTGLQVTTMR